MNDTDDLTSGRAATAQQPAEAPDEFGGATATAPTMQPGRVGNGKPRAGESQMVTAESTGDDFVSQEFEPSTATTTADYQDTGSTPSGEAFVEASMEQLESAEAGEESATSDLQEFDYAPITRTESDTVTPALEAGAVDTAQNGDAEFLPVLAALVPTLVSTIGPVVAKGVLNRLSPRARKHISNVAKTAVSVATARPPIAPTAAAATAAITAATKAGGRSGLVAMLSKLLLSAAAKPSGEASMVEAADPVIEQATQVLEVIIGTDDRCRITPTVKIPWRYYCALSGEFPDGARYTGTAFRIGRNALGTAGHCVYSHSHGGWARRLTVIAAADGDAKPYGTAQAAGLRSTSGWVNKRSAQTDIGCVVLPQSAFGGRNLGNFGFGVWSTQELLALPAVLAGYPGDKPFAQLWGMSRRIKAASATTLVYDIDSYGGQSGAPVYIKRNGKRFVVGIHNYGAQSGNSATRITQPIYALLQKWAAL